jgi:RNA polymerase sigma-70 factor (ECF subfamily)
MATDAGVQTGGSVGPVGNDDAAPLTFDAFYGREYPRVVRLVWSLVGRRDVAEELSQDAFLAAHQQWEKLATYDAPGAWVRRVAINKSRSRYRRVTVELRSLATLAARRSEQNLDLVAPDFELWDALRQLSPRQAEALALLYVEGMTAGQAAGVLGIAEDTVRTHARRGLAALAARLTADETDGLGSGSAPTAADLGPADVKDHHGP